MPSVEDTIVCGGGPAGLAAATWLGRYRRKTVLLDGGPPRNARALASHGYLGHDGQPASAFLDQARRDLDRYPTVQRVPQRAVGARRRGELFVVETKDQTWMSHRLLLATGVIDAVPGIPGFDQIYGIHAFHCSCCDGYESAGQDVLAIGWGEHAAGFAVDLLEWGARVVLITNGQEFERDRACEAMLIDNEVEVIEEKIIRFDLDGGALLGATLESGRSLRATRAFFSIKHKPQTDLAVQLGCDVDDQGYIMVGEHGETSIPGVFAAGDVTPGEQLVQRAAAEGAISGIACALSLRGMRTASSAPDPGPDPRAKVID